MNSLPQLSSSPAPREATSAASLICYLLPSIADMLFIALLGSLAYGTPRLLLLNDPGIGWHIRTGEWILQHHSIPHTDLFSNVTTRAWFAWEWLFEAALAKIHAWGGLNGVLASGAFVIALTFALLFRWTLRRGARLLAALAFVVLAVFGSTIHALARPHLLTWLFTLLCWYLLEQKRETRWLWFIPAIVLVWVNVHGGFLVAFALLGLTLLGDIFETFLGNRVAAELAPLGGAANDRRRSPLRLAILLAISFLASLCNPYGLRLYQHIYGYLGDSFLMHHIQEMQSPDFHSFGAKAFAALLLLAICATAIHRRRVHLGQIFVLIFFAASALVAVRNIPIATILLTLTAAPLLTERDPDSDHAPTRWHQRLLDFSQRMSAMETRSRGHLWAIGFTLLTIAACANGGSLFGSPLIHAGFNPEHFPLRAVNFLTQHPPTSPLFTTDAWGGYVIYRQWPVVRVVVDDRHDMYGSDYMRNYLKIINGEKDWQEQLEATGASEVLIPKNSALASLLRRSPPWRAVYEDDKAVVFEK